MRKKSIVIIMFIITAIILFLFALLIYNLIITQKVDDKTDIQMIQASENYEIISDNITLTNSQEIKISPNAIIVFSKFYSGCGHTVKSKEKVSINMVNMTESEFCNLYSDWKIDKFTSEEIELSKNFDGNCDEHFLVKSNNEYIEIYTIHDDNSLKLYKKTDIAVKYLTDDDIAELKEGITIYGRNNLNAYIESFE